ncbi:hypothetical protein [Pedobacter sp. KBW06]|uniref:hypothetical protein n=1 Tax=Pedobacter sp. KBW06 TaxID=2153359 RepID=UPI000F5A8E2E|nr:hypothetical protein [Pedobacter sp. KBW06]
MTKKITAPLILFFLSMSCYAQTGIGQFFDNQQEIVFDNEGKMIKFSRVFVTKSTSLNFSVVYSKSKMQKHFDKFTELLEKTQKTIDDNKEAYNCIFDQDISFINFNKQLKFAIEELRKVKVNNLQSLKDANAAFEKSGTNQYIPVSKYIEEWRSQYLVEAWTTTDFKTEKKLILNEGKASDTCYYIKSETPLKFKDLTCGNCEEIDRNELHFKLVYNDPLEATIAHWYAMKADSITKALQSAPDVEKQIIDELCQAAIAESGKFQSKFRLVGREFKDWMINLLWISGGVLTPNPFNSVTADFRTDSERILKKLDEEINIVKQQITFIDNSSKKVAEKIGNLPELKENISAGKNLTHELDSLNGEKKRLENLLKVNPLLSLLLEKKILYDGYIKVSPTLGGEAFPQKQFDAANRYNPVKQNLWDRRKNKEIPNSEKLQWVLNNVPEGTKIKFSEEGVTFKDTELFTKLINEELTKVDFSTFPSDMLGKAQDYFSSFLSVPSTGNKGANGKAPDCSDARAIIMNMYNRLHEGSLDLKPRAKPYFQQQESAPAFRTEQITSTIEQEDPHTINTTITRWSAKDSTKTEVVRKSTVNVGNERYFILSAGIAFNQSPLTVTQIDATNNGFKLTTEDSRARAIFGFKFFPLKNYNRDHGIIPRYFLKRLSIFGGAEILKPLNNFYVGGAYDLVPGLAFSAGRNYTLQTRYSIENNAITKTSRSYVNGGTYYSVMVNPVLFLQFIKLLFK